MKKRDFNNRNTQQKKERKPMVKQTYMNHVHDEDELFNLLKETHPVINDIVNPEFETEPDENGDVEFIRFDQMECTLENGISLQDIQENILYYVADNSPDIRNMDNMSVSVTLKSNKLNVHTNRHVNFSWFIEYEKLPDRKVKYVDIRVYIELVGEKAINDYENNLLDLGYDKYIEED